MRLNRLHLFHSVAAARLDLWLVVDLSHFFFSIPLLCTWAAKAHIALLDYETIYMSFELMVTSPNSAKILLLQLLPLMPTLLAVPVPMSTLGPNIPTYPSCPSTPDTS